MTTKDCNNILSDFSIDYSYVSSDHFPMSFKLNIDSIVVDNQNSNNLPSISCIKWELLSTDELSEYTHKCDEFLSNFKLSHQTLACTDVKCKNPDHIKGITDMYDNLVKLLLKAGESITVNKNCRFKKIPGWNDYVKELHQTARNAFLVWRDQNKPKHGPIFDLMKTSRALFKKALRACKSSEKRCTSDSLANKLLKKIVKSFGVKSKQLIIVMLHL